MSQRLIPAGEQSGLLTRIATTESVLLCARMKSGLRFWNSNRRFGLAANWFDRSPTFSPNSASLNGSESGGGLSPLGSLSLPDPQSQNQHGGKKERKNHESIESAQNNFTTSHHTGALLFRAFARAQAVVPPPDGGYPGLTTAEGRTPFKASPPALRTQQLAGFRSLATRRAASIPLLAPERYSSIPQTKIRHLARRRFYSTPPGRAKHAVGATALVNNNNTAFNC